jgi:hypothetical protein
VRSSYKAGEFFIAGIAQQRREQAAAHEAAFSAGELPVQGNETA